MIGEVVCCRSIMRPSRPSLRSRIATGFLLFSSMVALGCAKRESAAAPEGERAGVATVDAPKDQPKPPRAIPSASAPASPSVATVELRKGDFFFRVDGVPTVLVGRNPPGKGEEDFREAFEAAAAEGDRLVRIKMVAAKMARAGYDEEWAERWDKVFDLAERSGLSVLPVFGVHSHWNDGSKGERLHVFERNPFNAALGGPAHSPAELFDDTPCQRLWLDWLGKLVTRWQTHKNIVAWEVFSEPDLATGARPDNVAEFVERAAKVVRASDPVHRLVTVSLSGIVDWPKVFSSPSVDFVQVHPYAGGSRVYKGNLDDEVLATVPERLQRYGKPVLLGECDVVFEPPPPWAAPLRADRVIYGVQQGVWASAVSGGMAARMLWFSDGYERDVPLDPRYRDLAAPVARFVKGADLSGARPVEVTHTEALHGGAIGNDRVILAWFRDSASAAPDWPARQVSGQSVSLANPGEGYAWKALFFDTSTGSVTAQHALPKKSRWEVALPAFERAIALRVERAQ